MTEDEEAIRTGERGEEKARRKRGEKIERRARRGNESAGGERERCERRRRGVAERKMRGR